LLELREQTNDLLKRIQLENYLPDEYLKLNTDQPEYKILEDLKKILDILGTGEKIKTIWGVNKKIRECKYILNTLYPYSSLDENRPK